MWTTHAHEITFNNCVHDLGMVADGLIAGERPWSRGPDHDLQVWELAQKVVRI